MRVNIRVNIGRGSDPETTVAHYIRACWEKNKVILTGTTNCQGKVWNVRHTYHFENFLKKTKKEILKNLFL